MKAVMISIQPKWVEKIASGEKTIEVRKTRPKIDTPFKCYIYCTKDKQRAFFTEQVFDGEKGKWAIPHLGNGKVIGHFVCDNIYPIKNQYSDFVVTNATQGETNEIARQSCLDYDDMIGYFGDKDGYAWHISNLVIYDEPKELSEFWAYNAELNKLFNEGEDYCAWGRCETENGCTNDCDTENILNCYQCWADWNGWCHRLTRPFQSWGYVEEKE